MEHRKLEDHFLNPQRTPVTYGKSKPPKCDKRFAEKLNKLPKKFKKIKVTGETWVIPPLKRVNGKKLKKDAVTLELYWSDVLPEF